MVTSVTKGGKCYMPDVNVANIGKEMMLPRQKLPNQVLFFMYEDHFTNNFKISDKITGCSEILHSKVLSRNVHVFNIETEERSFSTH
jgi:hypothetical protein